MKESEGWKDGSIKRKEVKKWRKGLQKRKEGKDGRKWIKKGRRNEKGKGNKLGRRKKEWKESERKCRGFNRKEGWWIYNEKEGRVGPGKEMKIIDKINL